MSTQGPVVDLRSDTVTRPTPAMRTAMAEADVGDDVIGHDPTVESLEALTAERLGTESSLFVPSGTMGNLLAVMAHARPGSELIAPPWSHIARDSAGGLGRLAGVNLCAVETDSLGRYDLQQVRRNLHGPDLHHAPTALIWVENTCQALGGTVLPPDDLAALSATAKALPVHLDGARLFNAAAALGKDVRAWTGHADSVMFCLSKGLCAPVGSMLCGTRAFIGEARHLRKMLGGGMRQVGVLAAAGLVALEQMTERLAEDHVRARRLAEGLAEVPALEVDLDRVQTNIVYFQCRADGTTAEVFCRELEERGILALALDGQTLRMVVHHDVDERGIERTLQAAAKIPAGDHAA